MASATSRGARGRATTGPAAPGGPATISTRGQAALWTNACSRPGRRARRTRACAGLTGPRGSPRRLQLGGAGPGSPATVGRVGITIRPVRSGEDYAAWRQVLQTVEPGERAPTADELRAQAGPQQRYFVAELDGMLAGSGAVGRSDLAGSAFVAPRVLPACRRQGCGAAILRLLAEQAAAMGFGVAGGIVEDPGPACFADR